MEFCRESRAIAEEINGRLKEILGMKTNIGIGGCIRERQDLFHSYEDALAALQCRYIFGEESLFVMEDIRQHTGEQTETELAAEEILDAVKHSDTQAVSRIMEKMKKGVRTAGWTKERVHMYLQQQLDAVPELLRSFQLEEQDIVWEKERALEGMMSAVSLEQALFRDGGLLPESGGNAGYGEK